MKRQQTKYPGVFYRNAKRIGAGEKDKRDTLIYFLWKTGRLSNREIGTFFGLTYSAVRCCVNAINDRISVEQGLKTKYNKLYSHYSQFNGLLPK